MTHKDFKRALNDPSVSDTYIVDLYYGEKKSLTANKNMSRVKLLERIRRHTQDTETGI